MLNLFDKLLSFSKKSENDGFVSRETINTVFFISLILFSFFPLRHVFFTNSAYQTGAYSDFTSFSLYLSDLLIVALLLLNVTRLKAQRAIIPLLLFIGWGIVTILRSHNFLPLELYFLIKIIEFFALFCLLKNIEFKENALNIAFLVIVSCESLIAIVQFFTQKSIGLHFLGESYIGPSIDGVAKIVSHGTVYIRGYGTLPHSNILSAFIFVGILLIISNIYYIKDKKTQLLAFLLLLLNITGLVLTFSRASFIATSLATFTLILLVAMRAKLKVKTLSILLAVLLCVGLNIYIFQSFLITRATISDNAVKERVFYNNIGLSMLKDKPLTGVGIGESVLHMQQYSSEKLQPWEIQPIHNYYLITAAETGIVGLLLLLALFSYLGISLIIKTVQAEDQTVFIYRVFLGSTLLGFFILMLFDHYFYTIQSTQILFWGILGLIYREITRLVPQETN